MSFPESGVVDDSSSSSVFCADPTTESMASTNGSRLHSAPLEVDIKRHRYPFCIVWTPIPCLTWFFPFIGHMGIATSRGIIRDFAGPYFVSEDNMGFGWPTRYLPLNINQVEGGVESFDRSVKEASDEYKGRMHNLFCDNCHSHVAMSLNGMRYNGKENWNMITLCFWILFAGRYTGFGGFLKQWLPFFIMCGLIGTAVFFASRV